MRYILLLLTVLLLVFFISQIWFSFAASPVNKNDKNTQSVVIERGESVDQIVSYLEGKGLIRSALAFKLYVRQKGVAGQIQAGRHKLSPSMTLDEVILSLRGGSEEVWVTLLEGWREEEMANKLKEDLGIKREDFLAVAKEGYMFPDSYLFSRDATAKQVAEIMQNNFSQKLTPDLKLKIRQQGLTDEEGIVLASIVEREARSDEARIMVASILLKRLKIGMKLDVDVTIQYALGYQKDEKSWWKNQLSPDDKKIDSPYNTYKNAGLPPTPISNPSLSSLKAVAEADPSVAYLYYYHDSQGKSHYARTLEEQNQNVVNNP